MFELEYSNESDKAYGLAGMAISMASLDALDRIVEVWLDSEGPMVTFNHQYYFSQSPTVSAKDVWNNMVNNLQLTTSLVLGNVMARSLVQQRREIDRELVERLRAIVRDEARDYCSLDSEESDVIFDKLFNHSLRLFHNPRLHPAVNELAAVITRRRRLSVFELAEELELLRI